MKAFAAGKVQLRGGLSTSVAGQLDSGIEFNQGFFLMIVATWICAYGRNGNMWIRAVWDLIS